MIPLLAPVLNIGDIWRYENQISVMTFAWFCFVLFLQLLSNFNICPYYNLLCEYALFLSFRSALQTLTQLHNISEVWCNKHTSCLGMVVCKYGKRIMFHIFFKSSLLLKSEQKSTIFSITSGREKVKVQWSIKIQLSKIKLPYKDDRAMPMIKAELGHFQFCPIQFTALLPPFFKCNF